MCMYVHMHNVCIYIHTTHIPSWGHAGLLSSTAGSYLGVVCPQVPSAKLQFSALDPSSLGVSACKGPRTHMKPTNDDLYLDTLMYL